MDKFEVERNKYERAYKQPNYKMGNNRKTHAMGILNTWPVTNELGGPCTLLDVGCGRREIMNFAVTKGLKAFGTEIVSYLINPEQNVIYAKADDLPFELKTFDYITCLDVIEHLIPGTEIPTFQEFKRVARSRILMTIANFPSRGLAGEELHINIKPYKVWDELIRDTFSNAKVIWHPKGSNISETWEVILA